MGIFRNNTGVTFPDMQAIVEPLVSMEIKGKGNLRKKEKVRRFCFDGSPMEESESSG